jgi:hypothetical protein
MRASSPASRGHSYRASWRPGRWEGIEKDWSSFAEDLPVNEMAPREAIDASANCRAGSR